MGAALFGYSELYGSVPGGQAELLRVPQAQFTHIKVPDGPPDSRFVYLSDVLPTAWQAVAYAGIPDGGSVTVLGLGPIGHMADPLPMLTLFDKQVQLRMGQANVKKWVGDIMPLLTDDDPLGVESFASHVLPLAEAPHAYDIFQKKEDGAVKVILKP